MNELMYGVCYVFTADVKRKFDDLSLEESIEQIKRRFHSRN